MTVIAALRRTRTRTGRTLSVVADHAGLTRTNLSTIEHDRRAPRSDTIDRLAAALGITLIPVATGGRSTVAEAAEHTAAALAAGDTDRAYSSVVQLANDLDTATGYLRVVLAAEPAPPVAPGWDAFIAAVTAWRLEQAGLPTPDWLAGTLDSPTWTPPGAVLPARAEHVPAAFARRGVQVEEHELASA